MAIKFKKSNETKKAKKQLNQHLKNKPGEYTPSESVNNALQLLDQHLANKPEEYTPSEYDSIAKEALKQWMNREDFSYDVNADMLYQQYADQYTTLGKLASQDTMGQAAAMTGGYGSSYVSTAGNQAYQSYLQQLNEVVPELYQMAYDRYNKKGDDILNTYSLASGEEEKNYGRYRDNLSDWQSDRDYLSNNYWNNKNYDYGVYRDGVSDWQADRSFLNENYWNSQNFDFTKYSTEIGEKQWKQEFDEGIRQFNETLKKAKASGSGGGKTYVPSNPSVDDGNGNDEGVEGTEEQSKGYNTVKTAAKKYAGNNEGLIDYLLGQVEAGKITEEESDEIYAELFTPDKVGLKDRTWTLKDDGGNNWFWGIDGNATVTDQYGNTYRLDKLVDALVANGMSKDKAKDYVKNLQARLGA